MDKLISKGNYKKILKQVSSWPKWKKDLANNELLISKNSKKIK